MKAVLDHGLVEPTATAAAAKNTISQTSQRRTKAYPSHVVPKGPNPNCLDTAKVIIND